MLARFPQLLLPLRGVLGFGQSQLLVGQLQLERIQFQLLRLNASITANQGFIPLYVLGQSLTLRCGQALGDPAPL